MKKIINKSHLRNEIKYCPFCDKEHEIEVIKIKQKATIKNCDIEYDEIVNSCEVHKKEFEDGTQLDLNLLAMRDAYRRKNNLLTREDIINIRKKYNLTQEELSIILEFGEKTITRYETNSIQDNPHNTLLNQFNTNYEFAYSQLYKVQNKFSQKRFKQIREVIRYFISLSNKEIGYEQMLKNSYICIDKENSQNGYSLLNVDKIKSMFAYFATYTKNLFTVKLMKLFWYSDVLAYCKTGHAMTGLIYKHKDMGALPDEYFIIRELNCVDREPTIINDEIVNKFIPSKEDNINDSLFTNEELKILQKVCEEFCEISGTELSNIMHKENIYQITEDDEILDFSLIKDIKAIQL